MSTTAKLIEIFSGLIDSNGDPLSGYQVRTYAADGSTAQAVWEDRAKTLPGAGGKTSFSIGTDGSVEVYGDGVYIIKLWTATADPDVDDPYDTIGPNSFQPGGSAFDGDASDISILDVGSLITATDVDGALTENRTAIDALEVLVDQSVISGASPTFDNTNFSGTIENTGNVSGAITIDIADGDFQQLTATGNITGITIDNEPTGSWGILIEATNWGAFTITLGSIEVPGGSISFTASGKDILVLRGNGSNFSLSVAQEDIS